MYDNSFAGSIGVGGYTVVFGPSYPAYPPAYNYPIYTPPVYSTGFVMDGMMIAVLLLVGVLLFLK